MNSQISQNEIAAKYAEALTGLEKNTCPVFEHNQPVLIEGGGYPGIWLECGPP